MAEPLKYTVPFEPDELAFIQKKLQNGQQSLWTVMRSLMIIGIIIPVFTMIIFKSLGPENELQAKIWKEEFPDYYYLIAAIAIVVIIGAAGYYSYWSTVRKVAKDFKSGEKVVERTTIMRKVFMAGNKTFHFYLSSTEKLSIEVEMADYQLYRVGDEINIEYSLYAKEYFGYF